MYEDKKILILGAGTFQVPLIQRVNQLGSLSLSTSNQIKDPGHGFSSKAYQISTTDLDQLQDLAIDENISGITTLGSELGAQSSSYVAEKLGLPRGASKEVTALFNDKLQLRQHLVEKKLSSLYFTELTDLSDLRDFVSKPVMIKPTQGYGSEGIHKIDRFHDSQSGLLSTNKKYLLEEYFEGKDVSGDFWVKDGKIQDHYCTEKLINEHMVPYAHLLGTVHKSQKTKVFSALQGLVDSLSIQDGIFNFDARINLDRVEILDMGARLGGNHLHKLHEFSSGFDWLKLTINTALGIESKFDKSTENELVAVYLWHSAVDGRVVEINLPEHNPELNPYIINSENWAKVGQSVCAFTQGNRQLGFTIVRGESQDHLQHLLMTLHQSRPVRIKH